jgi:hypothetical protein
VVALRAVQINFAPTRHLSAWAWYFASVVFLALAAQQGLATWRACRQARGIEARVALLRANANHAEARIREVQATLQHTPSYAKDAAELARCAAFPLESVLTKVESAQVGAIKVVSLDLAPSEAIVYAAVEFGSPLALSHYLAAINDGETTRRWRLLEERVEDGKSPSHAKLAWE